MSIRKNFTLVAIAALAVVSAMGETGATDRPFRLTPKAEATSEALDCPLTLAARPELFAAKPIKVLCEHLRNPDGNSISCRAKGTSIVVDIHRLGGDALRYAYNRCQGMASPCSGIVSGVAKFRNGAIVIVDADIDFVEN